MRDTCDYMYMYGFAVVDVPVLQRCCLEKHELDNMSLNKVHVSILSAPGEVYFQ